MENDQTFEDEGVLEGADADEASDTDNTDTLDEDGTTNDSDNSDVISKLKEITGREFKDEEDFKKHYKNLSSFVGKKVEPKAKPIATDRVAELEFKVDHPEYKDHFDVIKMVAREKGVNYNDAISDPIVKELIEVRQSKKGESVIHSNNKISSNSSSLAKLKQNVRSEEGLVEYLKATLEE